MAPNETAEPESRKHFDVAFLETAKLAVAENRKVAPRTKLLDLKSAIKFEIAIVEK